MDKVMSLPLNCVCGGAARVRYKIPVVWVECRKKCGRKTGYFVDKAIPHDPDSEEEAIQAWNRMVQENGRTKYVHKN